MIKGKKGGLFGTLIFIAAVFVLFTYLFTCQNKVADTFHTKQYCHYFPSGSNNDGQKVCPQYKSQYKFNPDNSEWRSYISEYPILVTRINPQTFITNESQEYVFINEWVLNEGQYKLNGTTWIDNPDKC